MAQGDFVCTVETFLGIVSECEETSPLVLSGTFTLNSVRKGFIRRAYGVLTLQLMIIMAIIGLFFIEDVKNYTFTNSWIFWTSPNESPLLRYIMN